MSESVRYADPAPNKGRIALVLCGGGITGGMFEVGCLTALDDALAPEFRVNDFDLFVGVSAGALVAALLANGVRPRDTYEAILRNHPSPLNLKRTDIYKLSWGSVWQVLWRLVRGTITAVRLMARPGREKTIVDFLSVVEEYCPSGVFSLDCFEAYLARLLSPPQFSNEFPGLRRPLFIPAVELDTGVRRVFGEDFEQIPISKAVTASAAIPGFFQPVNIDGTDFIDGGVDRVAHLDIAVRHGASTVIVINPVVPVVNERGVTCIPRLDGVCSRLREKGLTTISDQASRISSRRNLALDLERHRLELPHVDVLLIEPEPKETTMFLQNVMNYSARTKILEYGYHTARGILAAHFREFEQAFGKHGIRLQSVSVAEAKGS